MLLEKIHELQSGFTPQELDEKYQQLDFVPVESDDLQQPPASVLDKFKDFLGVFIPQQGYFVTPILVNMNILIFIVMVCCGVDAFSPNGESLINWGANFRQMTLDQPWRLVSNFFLHIGVIHLLFNMYALVSIGVLLEPFLGKVRFSAAYLLSGIVASVVSLWWHDFTISAGASGAIFGLYGVFLALLTTDLIHPDARKELVTSISIFIGYNLFYGLQAGVDNAAHLGGLLSGFLIGYAMLPSVKKFQSLKLELLTLAGLGILVFGSSFIVYSQLPNNLGEYDKRMEVFVTNEAQALEVFRMLENEEKEKLLYALKDRGIYYWEENIRLVKELDKMELPAVIHERNGLLVSYCALRIKSYELMYKSTAEGDMNKYKPEIDNYVKQIDEVLGKLRSPG